MIQDDHESQMRLMKISLTCPLRFLNIIRNIGSFTNITGHSLYHICCALCLRILEKIITRKFLENCPPKNFIKIQRGNSQEKLLVLRPYDLKSSLRFLLWQLSVLVFRKILLDLLLDIRRKIHLQSLFQGQLTLE